MSAARVIPFPVRARSRHEISGPRAGVMNRPEEREPSPGSAWPWITFTGAAGVLMDLEPDDFEEPTGQDKEAAERLKATLVAPCDYARWLRLDAWTLQQAACIISGIDPDKALGTMNCFLSKHTRVDTPGRFEVMRYCAMFAESLKPMLQEMKGSHFAGKLKILGPWLDDLTMVDPHEAIRWAASKGYDIPAELEHQAVAQEARVQAPMGATEESSPPSPPSAEVLLGYAQRLMREYPTRAGAKLRIAEAEKDYPNLPSSAYGALARGRLPSDESAEADERWYFRNRPKQT